MTVKLRKRTKTNKISLYLDYYHNGKREYEYLKLYLYPKPKKGRLSKLENKHNKKTMELAERIRAKRLLELQSGIYGFEQVSKLKASFIDYMSALAEKKREEASKGTYTAWVSCLKHLKNFLSNDITFGQVNESVVEDFRTYLLEEARTKSDQPLTQNSACTYFTKFKAALKQAVKDNVIKENPGVGVPNIKQEDPQREFLTYEELQLLVNTPCQSEVLKRAFLFSCLTGLRWSDIQKLRWSEVRFSKENGYSIHFRQKKTKGAETLPISDQARDLLGDKGPARVRAFKGLKYSAWHNIKLREWVMRAGIQKVITFHCARHTYATLQLTMGTDIYTVSKMLGHKTVKTTEVYARIIDKKKKEAANKIKLEL